MVTTTFRTIKGVRKSLNREPSLTSIETDLTSSPDSERGFAHSRPSKSSSSKRRTLFRLFGSKSKLNADEQALAAFCSPGRPQTLKEIEESIGSQSQINSKLMASARSLRSSSARDVSSSQGGDEPIMRKVRKAGSSRKVTGSPRRMRSSHHHHHHQQHHQPIWAPPSELKSDVLTSPNGTDRKRTSVIGNSTSVIREPKSDIALASAVDQLLGGPEAAGTSGLNREEISISFAHQGASSKNLPDHAYVENDATPTKSTAEESESAEQDEAQQQQQQQHKEGDRVSTEREVTLEQRPQQEEEQPPKEEQAAEIPQEEKKVESEAKPKARSFDPPTPSFQRKHRRSPRRTVGKDINMNKMKGDDFRAMVAKQMTNFSAAAPTPPTPSKDKSKPAVPRVISLANSHQRARVQQQAQKAQRLLSEFDGNDEQWEADLLRLEAEVQKLRREVSSTRLTQFQHLNNSCSGSFSSLEDDEDSYYREQKAMEEAKDKEDDDDNEEEEQHVHEI